MDAMDEYDVLQNNASRLMRKQQWDAVLDLAKEYAHGHPERTKAWRIVVEIAMKARDKGGETFHRYNEEAIDAVTQYIQQNPGNAAAYASRGNLRLHRNNLTDAEQDYRIALSHRPDYFMASYGMGLVACYRGQWDEAERYLRETLKQHSRYPFAYHALGVTLTHRGRREEALQSLRMAVRLRPRNSKYRGAYANCLEALGQTEEAQAVRDGNLPGAADSGE